MHRVHLSWPSSLLAEPLAHGTHDWPAVGLASPTSLQQEAKGGHLGDAASIRSCCCRCCRQFAARQPQMQCFEEGRCSPQGAGRAGQLGSLRPCSNCEVEGRMGHACHTSLMPARAQQHWFAAAAVDGWGCTPLKNCREQAEAAKSLPAGHRVQEAWPTLLWNVFRGLQEHSLTRHQWLGWKLGHGIGTHQEPASTA